MTGDPLAQASRRVETLLDRFSTFPPSTGARADAEELVRIVSSLYGEGLRRIVETLNAQIGQDASEVLERCCADPLVTSLLVTHRLHPVSLEERIRRALDALHAELCKNNASVELVSADEDVVAVRIDGDADAVPLVEQAVHAAAPEVLEVRASGQTISLLSVR